MTAILTIETRLSSRFNFGELESIKSKIANLNLDQIIGKVAHDENLSIDEVREIAQQYKQFIYLAGVYGGVVPTKRIDMLWHAHILDTMKYDTFCQEVFNRKIHHCPGYSNQSFARCSADSGDDRKFEERTKELFMNHFGSNPFEDSLVASCPLSDDDQKCYSPPDESEESSK